MSSRMSRNGSPRPPASSRAASAGSPPRHGRRPHLPRTQHLEKDAAVRGVVVDDQHREILEIGRDDDLGRDARLRGQAEAGREVEHRSEALAALDTNLSVHQRHEVRRNRESKPRAAVLSRRRSVRLLERFENRVLLVDRNADAGVSHLTAQFDAGLGAPLLFDFQHDLARWRELNRVADQIDEHLAEATRIADEAVGDAWRHPPEQLQPLLVSPERDRAHRVRHHRA